MATATGCRQGVKGVVMRRSLYLWGIVVAMLVVLVQGCATSGGSVAVTPAPTPTPTPTPIPTGRGAGDTLRILIWQAPAMLNPHLTTNSAEWEVCRITYEPLASYDKDGVLVPFLADEIPSLENGGVSEDGLSVTWPLRDDVRWSDGEPFTANDVQFTYEYVTNPDVGALSASVYDSVEAVEIVDEYTVRVVFETPTPNWAGPFVGMQGTILPKHIFEPYMDEGDVVNAPANTAPIGTGPYSMVEFKPQEVLFFGNELIETNKISFEPNQYFRDEDKPFFSRVEINGGGSVNSAADKVLQDGTIDYAWNLQLPGEVLEQYADADQGQVLSLFGPDVERIALNRTNPYQETAEGERSSLDFPHPFLSELEVRQALALAIDRERIVELYGPTGRPTSNLLVSPSLYESDNTEARFDPEEARALLDEAGWEDSDRDGIREKDGVKMEMVYLTSASAVRQHTQQIVKENLEDIGIRVRIEFVDASTFNSNTNPNGSYRFHADMQEFYHGNSSPDPSAYMHFWTCDEIPTQANGWQGENVERWCNPEYDALDAQVDEELDPDKRRELLVAMNDMIVEQVVLIPLVNIAVPAGLSNSIEGVELTPWDANLWKIEDWRRKAL